jgi:hypothetical protein
LFVDDLNLLSISNRLGGGMASGGERLLRAQMRLQAAVHDLNLANITSSMTSLIGYFVDTQVSWGAGEKHPNESQLHHYFQELTVRASAIEIELTVERDRLELEIDEV